MKTLLHFSVFCLFLVYLIPNSNAVTYEEDTKLNKEQKQAFSKFKARVTPKLSYDYQKEDLFLIRYLRAKKFDIAKAEEYILTQMKWRRDTNMETIHKENWSDMIHDYPMRVDHEGVDREGRPLIVYELGDWDIRKAAVAGKMDRIVRWTIKNWDMARIKIRELELQGKNVTRWTMVLDLKNMNAVSNVNPASLPYYLATALGYDGHFPNWSNTIFLLNTPNLFETVLSLVKPVLDKNTRDSLMVYGKNPGEWGPILKAAVDPKYLPKRYGGQKEDPN
jgi:hypothetical protein